MEKYLCWFIHEKQYVPYKAMIERIVKSTSSSNNMHGVIDDNSNRYRSMIMDAMRINQSDVGEWSIIDEKQNADVARAFDFLKDFD